MGAEDTEGLRWVGLGRDVDVVPSPRCAGYVEERLGINELDMIVIERRMEFWHVGW